MPTIVNNLYIDNWVSQRKTCPCQWFSGKIQRCHRWAPSSILGSRTFSFVSEAWSCLPSCTYFGSFTFSQNSFSSQSRAFSMHQQTDLIVICTSQFAHNFFPSGTNEWMNQSNQSTVLRDSSTSPLINYHSNLQCTNMLSTKRISCQSHKWGFVK